MKNTLSIVISDPIHESGVEILRSLGNVRSHAYSDKHYDRRLLVKDLKDADVLVLRAMRITVQLLDDCPNLKLIARHGIGIDHIDLPAATRRGIVVTNTGETSSLSVAETAMTLVLATLKRTTDMHRAVLEERLVDNFHMQHWSLGFGDVSGRTLGLVGFGNIARHVGRMCGRGFDMKVMAYDPHVGAEQMSLLGVEKVNLPELLTHADIVSIHAPLLPETRNMIGAAQLSLMKSNAILVHTSRGGVVDENALYLACRDGVIAGAGVDVYEAEPPRASNPLCSLSNVVLSPHVGGLAESAKAATATELARIVGQVISGAMPSTVVNKDVWKHRRL